MADAVFLAAQDGDPAAVEIVNSFIYLLAKSIGALINILDIELVILGGGVINHSPQIAGLIHDAIAPFIAGQEVLKNLQIKTESLPNSALFGAGAMVFRLKEGN